MIRITSTNGNKRQRDAVRAYVNGTKVADLSPGKANGLRYFRSLSRSKHHVELDQQLTAAMEQGLITFEQSQTIKKTIFPLIHG